MRCTTVRLGRAPSTISRELARNGGRSRCRAHHADRTASHKGRRPKPSKLAENPVLRTVVEEKLAEWWSPQQVVLWLKRTYPSNPEMYVSHETIYLSLFVQGKGALRRELTDCLRTGRAYRRPKTKRAPSGKGQIVDPVMISERPPKCCNDPLIWQAICWVLGDGASLRQVRIRLTKVTLHLGLVMATHTLVPTNQGLGTTAIAIRLHKFKSDFKINSLGGKT
jgi:hypothetical protein